MLYMVTCNINIPQMLAYIPAPWILWYIYNIMMFNIIKIMIYKNLYLFRNLMMRRAQPSRGHRGTGTISGLRHAAREADVGKTGTAGWRGVRERMRKDIGKT